MKDTEVQQPVTGKEFFDREEFLEKLIKGGQNIALTGVRKAGKQAFLSSFWLFKASLLPATIIFLLKKPLIILSLFFFNAVAFAYLKRSRSERNPPALAVGIYRERFDQKISRHDQEEDKGDDAHKTIVDAGEGNRIDAFNGESPTE